MLFRTRFAAALGAAILLPAAALADSVSEGIAALPGGVEDVRIAGTFDQDGRSGAYRIVIARSGVDPVAARLFIQWVVYDDMGGATLAETLEIKELSEAELDIVDFTSESDGDGLSVYLETLNPDGGPGENYELFVFSPTEYRFGPATN